MCAALHTSRLGLLRRSRHLPASVIVHAGRIQRVVRSPPIWLIELTHAGACGHFDRRIRPIPMSGRTDAERVSETYATTESHSAP